MFWWRKRKKTFFETVSISHLLEYVQQLMERNVDCVDFCWKSINSRCFRTAVTQNQCHIHSPKQINWIFISENNWLEPTHWHYQIQNVACVHLNWFSNEIYFGMLHNVFVELHQRCAWCCRCECNMQFDGKDDAACRSKIIFEIDCRLSR